MLPADLPLPQGATCVPFTLASPRQVAQALVYATERLAPYFPTLSWTTWSDSFRHVQPELVVQGPAVWLQWSGLVRLVQRLSLSSDSPVLDLPGYGPAVAEPTEQPTAYQHLVRPALAQREETPGGYGPLLCEPAVTLAKDHAPTARVDAAPPEAADEKRTRPDSPVPDQQPASVATGPPAAEQEAARSGAPARRTFRDIVQYHPRANGKQGFTVRELCRAMRISAASLREAHINPGRLTLNAVNALAALMQEPLLPVLADLLAGAGTRKRRNG